MRRAWDSPRCSQSPVMSAASKQRKEMIKYIPHQEYEPREYRNISWYRVCRG